MPADFANQAFEAGRLLAVAGIVRIAYTTARNSAVRRGVGPAIWRGVGVTLAIALFAAVMMGSPTCNDLSDQMFGSCEVQASNGYDASIDQRAARFLFWEILLLVPIGLGVVHSQRPRATRRGPEA